MIWINKYICWIKNLIIKIIDLGGSRWLYIEELLLKFYEHLVPGSWAVAVLMPIDQLIYDIADVKHNVDYYHLSYGIFLLAYTIFFILSSAVMPSIRMMQLKRRLKMISVEKNNTNSKAKIFRILKDNVTCRSIFTVEGILQFGVSTLYNVAMIAAYYGFEHYILMMASNEVSVIIVLSYIVIFIVCMSLIGIIDRGPLSNAVRKKRISDIYYYNNLHGEMLREVIYVLSGDDAMRRLINEDLIRDICKIFHIHDEIEYSGDREKINSNTKKDLNLMDYTND